MMSSLAGHDAALGGGVAEVVRKRRGDPKWLIRQRMRHRKLPRVQHRPDLVALAVQPVAGQRMPDRCQMDADLVRAAGEQIDRDERAALAWRAAA